MEEVLEDAVAFAGVSKYPARVKCALLSWMAWKDATAQALGGTTQEDGMSDETREATKPASEDEVREALYDVVDPELGIDVVNLGLIYGIHVDDADIATLDMTLTSAACPLTDVIEDQARGSGARRRHRQRLQDQLGLDAAVGPGQDHRRRPRAAARAGLQRLSGPARTAPGAIRGPSLFSAGRAPWGRAD